MENKNITSISDLLTHLSADNDGYKGFVWYRGQSSKSWKLDPGFYRMQNPPSEWTLLKRFKQSAGMLIDKSPGDSFDWLFLMQHYGVPTRLLDWSESPLAALYFAVNKADNNDAALWALRPTELNKNAGIHDAEEFFIPSFEDTELSNYSVENLAQNKRSKLLPIATIATRNNARIQAQLGVFTIHHLERISIEAIGEKNHIRKYIVPKGAKPGILEELSLLGFNKFQLFPELASIGDSIKEGLS